MSIRIQCPLVYQLYMLLVFVLAMVLANDYQIGYYRPYSAYSNGAGNNNGGQRRSNAGGGGGGSRIITGFQCPYPNGRFAHPFKCDRYIQCNDDGMPELRFCLDGKWFDEFVKCCRPKAEAHCLSRPKPKARIGPIQPPPPDDPYYLDPVPPPPPPPPPQYYTSTNGTSTTSTTTSTTPPSTTTRSTTTTQSPNQESANLADYDGEF